MAELKETLTRAKLKDVKTLLASGNVIFETDLSDTQAKELIETLILQDFGLEISCVVLRHSIFRKVLTHQEIITTSSESGSRAYICFIDNSKEINAQIDNISKEVQTLA